MDSPCWKPFDEVICGLVDRLRAAGYTHVLEVEFHLQYEGFDEEEHKKFLPGFKEKGRVRIFFTPNGGVKEWP